MVSKSVKVAGSKKIVSGEIVKEAVIIVAVTIFKALKVELTRLNFFSVVEFFSNGGNIGAVFDRVGDEELKSPNDVCGVFDIAGFLERFKGDLRIVIDAIERTDYDEGSISVALEGFEFVNNVINASFVGGKFKVVRRRDNLKVVNANNGRFVFVIAVRSQNTQEIINGLIAQFNQIDFVRSVCNVAENFLQIYRLSANANIGGGYLGESVTREKLASDRFGKEFKSRHFVGAEQAVFATVGKLFKKLPSKSSFTASGSSA